LAGVRRRSGETLSLARALIQALRKATPSKEALQAARLHFTDALGVGLAAAGSPVGQPYRLFSKSILGQGPATVLGASQGAAPADAALVNGGLMHSLEFDDTHTGSIMHGSSVVAAAALAAGESNDASGKQLLMAYTRGWEALVLLGLAAPGKFHAQGFQATSIAGTLAAALVAAELGGLNEDQTVAALGIALSQSSGVMEFLSNGSSVKSLHSGWAAHGGLLAAELARAGMNGPETLLEGRYGLFRVFADDENAIKKLENLIQSIRWHVQDAAFKFYPCCHYLHPFIEAAGKLDVKAADVISILCEVPAGAAPVICEPWERALEPPTGHAARWSLPVAVAARIAEGKVDLATFETKASPAVLALAKKVRWEPLKNARFPERFEAVVTVETSDGKKKSVRIDDVDGNHTRPPTPEKVMRKFRANAARSLAPDQIEMVENTVTHLLTLDDLKKLTAALRTR
jgi:2-methylcitrate dehydratase PrpD